MIKITILIDNRANPLNNSLSTEHGLSLHIEFNQHRILCDMGASANYADNSKTLGIDLSDIDFGFVSHSHLDHTGGLRNFLDTNHHCDVYLSDKIFGNKFYSSRGKNKRNISTDALLQQQYADRFVYVDQSQWIDNNIAIVRTEHASHSMPYANRFLTMSNASGERKDDFAHELALVLNTDKGAVIISSCSHMGAVNIIDSCRKFTGVEKVYAFIGGLHFVDSDTTDDEVEEFIKDMQLTSPETIIYTG
ncbi:MAG: MBL fold metallo-hydrolase, partial [Rikenellaceae bacterium]